MKEGRRMRYGCKRVNIHPVDGDVMWWLDDRGIIQWRVCDGTKHRRDVSPLDMDARWRGRLDKAGNATLLPPLAPYAGLDAEEMPLPVGAMTTLEHIGAKRFYLDSRNGLVRLGALHSGQTLRKSHSRYHDIGHGEGAILWWLDNRGKMQTHKSTGREFHHELNKRMNFDTRWRGRVEPSTGRASLLPPIGTEPIHVGDEVRMEFPRRLLAGLKRLGGRNFMCVVDDRLWVVLKGRKEHGK